MRIKHKMNQHICIITLDGELVGDEVDALQTRIQPLLKADTIKAVFLDLDKVTFIDSSGIGFLITTGDRLKARDIKFSLYHLTRKNEEIFRLAHINQFLNVYATEAEAMNHL